MHEVIYPYLTLYLPIVLYSFLFSFSTFFSFSLPIQLNLSFAYRSTSLFLLSVFLLQFICFTIVLKHYQFLYGIEG
jgi:hypothetical protein